MSEVRSLISRIEEARSTLNKLIKDKNDLVNPEVVRASKELDILLNIYNKYSSRYGDYIKLCL